MTTVTLTGQPIYEARRFMRQFVANGHPLRAAFWVRVYEKDYWSLYLVTDLVGQSGSSATYGAVRHAMSQCGDMELDVFYTTVIDPSDPVARHVIHLMAQHTGRWPLKLRNAIFGRLSIDEAIIYSPDDFAPVPAGSMTEEEVGRALLDRMRRKPELVGESRVVLRDADVFDGVPVGLQYDTKNALTVAFMTRDPAPRVVRLEDIVSIT